MRKDLQIISNNLRKEIIKTAAAARIPHIGSCLSCLDILVYLYWEKLNINPNQPLDKNRDRFLLSKGGMVPQVYSKY